MEHKVKSKLGGGVSGKGNRLVTQQEVSCFFGSEQCQLASASWLIPGSMLSRVYCPRPWSGQWEQDVILARLLHLGQVPNC